MPDQFVLLDQTPIPPTAFHLALVAVLLVTQVRLLVFHLALLVVAAAGVAKYRNVRVHIGRRYVVEVFEPCAREVPRAEAARPAVTP